jgi:hypothetical protein
VRRWGLQRWRCWLDAGVVSHGAAIRLCGVRGFCGSACSICWIKSFASVMSLISCLRRSHTLIWAGCSFRILCLVLLSALRCDAQYCGIEEMLTADRINWLKESMPQDSHCGLVTHVTRKLCISLPCTANCVLQGTSVT